MHKKGEKPRALFLSPDGKIFRDDQICSGDLPSRLAGKACPFSDMGRMPRPRELDEVAAQTLLGSAKIGEMVPPCVVQQLGVVHTWQNIIGVRYPGALRDLKVFKCRQMFVLVVPGLKGGQAEENER